MAFRVADVEGQRMSLLPRGLQLLEAAPTLQTEVGPHSAERLYMIYVTCGTEAGYTVWLQAHSTPVVTPSLLLQPDKGPGFSSVAARALRFRCSPPCFLLQPGRGPAAMGRPRRRPAGDRRAAGRWRRRRLERCRRGVRAHRCGRRRRRRRDAVGPALPWQRVAGMATNFLVL